MNDQLRKRIPLIHGEKLFEFRRILPSKPCLHRDANGLHTAVPAGYRDLFCAFTDSIQKAVHFLRILQHPGALSLCRDRSDRTAEVQIDFRIAKLRQIPCAEQKLLRVIRQDLRNRRHTGIVLRQNVSFFPGLQLLRVGCHNKRGKICIQTRKILMMRLPEAIARDPLKGRKIISHFFIENPRVCLSNDSGNNGVRFTVRCDFRWVLRFYRALRIAAASSSKVS